MAIVLETQRMYYRKELPARRKESPGAPSAQTTGRKCTSTKTAQLGVSVAFLYIRRGHTHAPSIFVGGEPLKKAIGAAIRHSRHKKFQIFRHERQRAKNLQFGWCSSNAINWKGRSEMNSPYFIQQSFDFFPKEMYSPYFSW